MQSIHFISATPEELVEQAARRTVELLLPHLHKHHTRPETRRYTRKQTAELLGVTLTTLWAKTKEGLIQSERFGRRVLYSEDAIEAALTKRNFGVSKEGRAKR